MSNSQDVDSPAHMQTRLNLNFKFGKKTAYESLMCGIPSTFKDLMQITELIKSIRPASLTDVQWEIFNSDKFLQPADNVDKQESLNLSKEIHIFHWNSRFDCDSIFTSFDPSKLAASTPGQISTKKSTRAGSIPVLKPKFNRVKLGSSGNVEKMAGRRFSLTDNSKLCRPEDILLRSDCNSTWHMPKSRMFSLSRLHKHGLKAN